VLGVKFPEGYREFMTRLGRGAMAGHLIYVHAPEHILASRKAWQERVDTYWNWGEDGPVQSEVVEGYRLGDTADGDEFVVVRGDPDRIYVLPRNDSEVLMGEEGLMETLGWFLTSGDVREQVEERDFHPAKKSAE
jgi:hypothetical protein